MTDGSPSNPSTQVTDTTMSVITADASTSSPRDGHQLAVASTVTLRIEGVAGSLASGSVQLQYQSVQLRRQPPPPITIVNSNRNQQQRSRLSLSESSSSCPASPSYASIQSLQELGRALRWISQEFEMHLSSRGSSSPGSTASGEAVPRPASDIVNGRSLSSSSHATVCRRTSSPPSFPSSSRDDDDKENH